MPCPVWCRVYFPIPMRQKEIEDATFTGHDGRTRLRVRATDGRFRAGGIEYATSHATEVVMNDKIRQLVKSGRLTVVPKES